MQRTLSSWTIRRGQSRLKTCGRIADAVKMILSSKSTNVGRKCRWTPASCAINKARCIDRGFYYARNDGYARGDTRAPREYKTCPSVTVWFSGLDRPSTRYFMFNRAAYNVKPTALFVMRGAFFSDNRFLAAFPVTLSRSECRAVVFRLAFTDVLVC